MEPALLGALVALALVDSTSFGTLLIPVWLLLVPGRVRVGRVLVYLGTIVAFYFVAGLVLVLGAGAFLDTFAGALDAPAVLAAQLVLGAGLVALSFRIDSTAARRRQGPGRLARWRERAIGSSAPDADPLTTPGTARLDSRVDTPSSSSSTAVSGRGSVTALMALALGAAVLEVASMLPYLAAIGLLTSAGLGTASTAAVLAGYCLVMVAPALVLLLGRVVAGSSMAPLLERLSAWMSRHAASAAGWVVGIIGALLALDALSRLGWL